MKKGFFWICKLAITVGILAYIFGKIPGSEVIGSIASADPWYILAAFSITGIIRILEACQMKILTDHQRLSLSLSDIVGIGFASSFYSLFLPGFLSGGAIRWYRFSRPENKPFEALASITFWGLADTFLMVLIGTVLLALDISGGAYARFLPYMVVVLSGFLGAFLLIFHKFTSIHLGENMEIGRGEGVLAAAKKGIRNMFRSIVQFRDLPRRSFFRMAGLSLAAHALGVLIFFLFALSLELDLTVMTLGWIRSFIRIVTMLPVSISGFGVREGTLIIVLGSFGVAPAQAISFSLLLFSRVLLVGLVGGILEMIPFLFSKFLRTDGKKNPVIVRQEGK